MQANRRRFLGGMLAAGLIPKPTWADAGGPAYLAAAAKPDGSFALCGIGRALNITFEIPLPARGHAAAAHPTRPQAVAFARRPGRFAVVIDCVSGAVKAQLDAPQGRHFYGHGAFSQDGDWLFTTENDYEHGQGRIGVWDVSKGYTRVGEFHSGGVGPHDIKRLPGSDVLVVANGGIDTHPDSGRVKLNIATMQPNLTYLDQGQIIEVAQLPPEMHKNSIRHLAIGPRGQVAFGMQWQGDGQMSALIGQHRQSQPIQLIGADDDHARELGGYIGSIAYSRNGKMIAVTSPRGGVVHQYDANDLTLDQVFELQDVCGVAPQDRGFAITSGRGDIGGLGRDGPAFAQSDALRWDNHLVEV
ncbi:hypothetical protein SAMN04488040_2893 [Sulfitobacter marinus]|uniref:Twin-arginine translocation pathway signal n=1 Tax=Sulfitobacter marinus TaxID=394264 RepID=A0A1I6UPZ1_9RHOB|nr:DUF1513 domain-containing protein [Sulfitobacter marinus]SFT03473.1 hypothetical protein SAMN04488040_2893 [Sulfitobacter marinus]